MDDNDNSAEYLLMFLIICIVLCAYYNQMELLIVFSILASFVFLYLMYEG